MTTVSRDYHDYVFKGGELIGDFEGMYRNSAEVPWRQDRTAHDVSADVGISILRKERYRAICDVGSGLGYFTARLQRELSTPDGGSPAVTGIEVSPTAVAEASRNFPGVRFVVGNLLDEAWAPPGDGFDLVVVKDVLWYVCQGLDTFLGRVAAMARGADGCGVMYVSQSFPGTKQWVGQDVIGSHQALIDCLRRFVRVDYSCAERAARWEGGTALHVLGRVRDDLPNGKPGWGDPPNGKPG